MRLLLVSFAVFAIALHPGCGEPKSNEMLTVEKADGIMINDVGVAKFPTPSGWSPNRSSHDTAVVLLRSDAIMSWTEFRTSSTITVIWLAKSNYRARGSVPTK